MVQASCRTVCTQSPGKAPSAEALPPGHGRPLLDGGCSAQTEQGPMCRQPQALEWAAPQVVCRMTGWKDGQGARPGNSWLSRGHPNLTTMQGPLH